MKNRLIPSNLVRRASCTTAQLSFDPSHPGYLPSISEVWGCKSACEEDFEQMRKNEEEVKKEFIVDV